MTPAREVTHRRKRSMGLTLHIDITDVSTALPASKRTSPVLAAYHIASSVPPASLKELQVVYCKNLKSVNFFSHNLFLTEFCPILAAISRTQVVIDPKELTSKPSERRIVLFGSRCIELLLKSPKSP